MRSRARRRDENEGDIVAALRRVGASVVVVDAKGTPDLLVGFRGETFLLEVKHPTRGTLTEDQVEWWRDWRGRPPVIVASVEEAFAAIGAIVFSKET